MEQTSDYLLFDAPTPPPPSNRRFTAPDGDFSLYRTQKKIENTWSSTVTEKLVSIDTIKKVPTLDEPRIENLYAIGATLNIAGPNKVHSEDACFVADGLTNGFGAAGVADGVGELSQFGLDPARFSAELMQACCSLYKEDVHNVE
eukprot:Platyproteum_vivax@DN7440_c0_g3_i1.p1